MKDEEYVKSLKKQNDDIDELIQAMKKQFKDMRLEYGDQLTTIENAFYSERNLILEKNRTEIIHLFDEHKKLEDHFLSKKD